MSCSALLLFCIELYCVVTRLWLSQVTNGWPKVCITVTTALLAGRIGTFLIYFRFWAIGWKSNFCCFYTLLVMVHCDRDWEGSLVDQYLCITVTTGLWACARGIFLTYFRSWSNRLICCFLAVSTPCLLRCTMRETEKGFWFITMYV